MTERRAAASAPPDESQTQRVVEIILAAARPEQLRIPIMVSKKTIAQRIDVSQAWVEEWHRRGLLRGVVLKASPGQGRGRLLFRESDVIEFLEARGIEIAPDKGAGK